MWGVTPPWAQIRTQILWHSSWYYYQKPGWEKMRSVKWVFGYAGCLTSSVGVFISHHMRAIVRDLQTFYIILCSFLGLAVCTSWSASQIDTPTAAVSSEEEVHLMRNDTLIRDSKGRRSLSSCSWFYSLREGVRFPTESKSIPMEILRKNVSHTERLD